MFNMNSPTIQNMLYGKNNEGVPQGTPSVYMPQSNIMNVGGYGYNQPMQQQQIYNSKYLTNQYQNPIVQQPMSIGSTYYNNNSSRGYFNPYMYQQQMELQRIQQQEEQNQQSSIMKRLSKSVNKALGEEVDEKYLSQYDIQKPQQQENMSKEEYEDYLEMQNNDHLARLSNNSGFVQSNIENRLIAADIAISEKYKKKAPDDMSMAQFFTIAGALYDDAIMKDQIANDRDVTRVYNKGLFGKLINKSINPMGTFGSSLRNSVYQGPLTMNNNLDISDMEIQLPDRMMNEYQRRKQEFMNNILKG